MCVCVCMCVYVCVVLRRASLNALSCRSRLFGIVHNLRCVVTLFVYIPLCSI